MKRFFHAGNVVNYGFSKLLKPISISTSELQIKIQTISKNYNFFTSSNFAVNNSSKSAKQLLIVKTANVNKGLFISQQQYLLFYK